MRSFRILVLRLLLVAACTSVLYGQAPPTATLYEGARLITGDGSAPIDNSAFVVENNRFTRIGRKGEVQAPAGAARVDLTGKTVMPTIIDGHSHPGYTVVRTNETRKDTYTKDNLIDHLRRFAYYGVAATMSMGVDRGNIPFEVRANPSPDAALLLTAGGGIALPDAGPGAEFRKDAAFGVTTEAEARKVVQGLARQKVDLVKLWVDDRAGTVPKLPPNLYRVIIDEAHKQKLRTIAHIFYLVDAKELMRAGIDGFAHGVRDRDIDDEFMAQLKQRRVFFTPNLPDRPLTAEDLPLVLETLPPQQAQRVRDLVASRGRGPAAGAPPATAAPQGRGGVPTGEAMFPIQARNLKRISDAGVADIGLGTDSGDNIGWPALTEMADMVTAGMTPSQVIVAATKTTASILHLDQLGTIASGKSAYFLVLDANPLDDIRNTRRISKVFFNGREVNRAALRATFTAAR